MSSTTMEALAPLATALPDPPADNPFAETHWKTLLAIMDTVVPSVRREGQATDKSSQLVISDEEYHTKVEHLKKAVTNSPSTEALDVYLGERPSEIPRFQELMKRLFTFYVREDARKGLGFILAALE